MPIGTQSTALLLKTYKPKITRITQKETKQNFWKLFFETILITVAATAAGTITGGFASGAVLSLGASDFVAGLVNFGTRVLVDFAINQSIDSAKNQASSKSTALNILLSTVTNANLITRGYRTTKILALAKSTKTLEKLGVKEAKNIKAIIKQLSNTELITKEINNKKQLFKFGKLNSSKVLQEIGFVSQESFIFNFKNLTANEIKENLLLQVNLAKLSPKLLPSFKIKNIDNVNNFLKKFGTDYQTVINMNQFEWLNLIAEFQKNNSGKLLILALQQIRNDTVKYNLSSQVLSKTLNRINKTLRYFDINFYINKGLEKVWENSSYFTKLKGKILDLQKRIAAMENKVLNKIQDLAKQGKKFFTEAEKLAIQEFNLVALTSPVFLACKIDPITLTEVAITIFHKDPRYEPIIVVDTMNKAEEFINQDNPFSWYWNESNWPLGYGINKNSIFNFVKLLPNTARIVTMSALRINFQIKRIKQKVDGFIHNDLTGLQFQKGLPINFFVKKILNNRSTRVLRPVVKQIINHKQPNIKRTTISNSAHYVKRKIRRRII